MPDLDHLEQRLRETGARLFDDIRIPELSQVRRRADRIRRRRTSLAAGASTLALMSVAHVGATRLALQRRVHDDLPPGCTRDS